jgi:hypothetical protein
MRDRKKINNNLVKRGSLFVDFSFLDNWEKEMEDTNKLKASKRGPKFKYPNVLFYLTALLSIFLPFRQIEGFLLGLSKLKPFKVPDYTTIFRRVRKLNFNLKTSLRTISLLL